LAPPTHNNWKMSKGHKPRSDKRLEDIKRERSESGTPDRQRRVRISEIPSESTDDDRPYHEPSQSPSFNIKSALKSPSRIKREFESSSPGRGSSDHSRCSSVSAKSSIS
ncbi:hypothetical protein PFISCL1PPCAC_27173, partial [Pristionchus fissidentatus]